MTSVCLPVFEVGLGFFGGVGRGDGFFARFLLVFLIFLDALVTGAFFRFLLAFALVFLFIAITASWTLNSILKVRSLPNKKVCQPAPLTTNSRTWTSKTRPY
jgi:hypothetical protein